MMFPEPQRWFSPIVERRREWLIVRRRLHGDEHEAPNESKNRTGGSRAPFPRGDHRRRERGNAADRSGGCGTCHTFDPVKKPQAAIGTGPDLLTQKRLLGITMSPRKKMKTAQTLAATPQTSATNPFSRPATGIVGHIQSSLIKSQATSAKSKRQIRLLIVDDHPVVRKGITSCLSGHSKIQLIGEAANGTEALNKARELKPDIILMDIDLPEKSGLVVTETIRKELPQIKVLILSMHTNTDYVLRIVQSGASGYVLKGGSTEELLRAIETVNEGESFFSPEVARTALNQFVRGSNTPGGLSILTTREREVLIHIADGMSNKEIASQLGVGVRTVETHRERIMKKLAIHSVAGLTKFAISQGLVSLNG